jgi:hypothetical protein
LLATPWSPGVEKLVGAEGDGDVADVEAGRRDGNERCVIIGARDEWSLRAESCCVGTGEWPTLAPFDRPDERHSPSGTGAVDADQADLGLAVASPETANCVGVDAVNRE